jgi:hypothetical protein
MKRGAGFVKKTSVRSARSVVNVFCLCVACGYAPVRRAARGIHVAAVRNDTAQAEAGGLFAQELRAELAGRGRLDPDGAPGDELAAELVSITSSPTAAGADGALAFALSAVLRIRIGPWEDTAGGSEDYASGVDVLGTEANRRAALRRLARALARQAIERYDVAERLR